MAHGTVIVGTGQGGFQLAASLRDSGYADPITLVGDEPGLPYQRPPLSKAFLQGKVDDTGLLLRPPPFYQRIDARVLGGTRVARIDRAEACAGNAGSWSFDLSDVLAHAKRSGWGSIRFTPPVQAIAAFDVALDLLRKA